MEDAWRLIVREDALGAQFARPRLAGLPPDPRVAHHARRRVTSGRDGNAAEATGHAARPLPLFYALSQAGQAIEACAGQRPARNHGLDVKMRTVAEVGQILARYPDAEGKWRPVATTPELLGVRAYAGRWVVRVLWNDGGKGISGVAPEFRGVYVLRPALVDAQRPPSLLMTWWLITYTISELARYEPERWVNALKVDSSRDAVSKTLVRGIREDRGCADDGGGSPILR